MDKSSLAQLFTFNERPGSKPDTGRETVINQTIPMWFVILSTAAYYRSRLIGWLNMVRSWISKQDNRLIDIQPFRENIDVNQWRYSGVKQISMDSIVGSDGKCDAYDTSFSPLNSDIKSEWIALAVKNKMAHIPDPIKLIGIERKYFVQAGILQISVSKGLGKSCILADIIKWDLNGIHPLGELIKPEDKDIVSNLRNVI